MWYRSESVLLGGDRIATRNNKPTIRAKAAVDTISNLPKLRMDCMNALRPTDNHLYRQATAKNAAKPTSHKSAVHVLFSAPNRLSSSVLRTKYAATTPEACKNARRHDVSVLLDWIPTRTRKAPRKVRAGRRMSMDAGLVRLLILLSAQAFI